MTEFMETLTEWIKILSNQNNEYLESLIANDNDDDDDDVTDNDEDYNFVESVQYWHVDQWLDDEDNYKNMKSGILTFKNQDTFKGWFSEDFQNRIGVLTRWSGDGLKTTGIWRKGKLEGQAWIENAFGGYEETCFKDGLRHGFSRAFGPCPNRSDNLWHVGRYRHGDMVGRFWRGCLGGGYITGIAENNDISGDNLTYIFPNLIDGVSGEFFKGKLVTGELVKLCSVEIVDGIAVPEFRRNESKNLSKVTRDISTAFEISKTPLVPDKLEHDRVEVKQSNNDTAGEGLFAKTQFISGDLVSILNGTRVIPSIHEDWSDYKVHFSTEFDIDIPEDMRRMDQYCTTLAHKANHSFTPNTKWGRMDHPRFGFVVTLLACRAITMGEEITVNYNYSRAIAPPWYKQCLADFNYRK